MSRTLAHPLIAAAAALLILVFSTVSAAWMAPDRDTAQAAAASLAFGLGADDLCGDVAGHDHRCPFCRLVADPPAMDPVTATLDLRPADLWQARSDLAPAPFPGTLRHAPRAPPARA